MRSFLSALALQLVFLVLTSLGQVSPAKSSDQNSKQPAPCRVSGKVLSAADGAMIKSARVALVEENERSHPKVFATTTDSDGHFEIKDVLPGRFIFFASHTGYVSQRYQGKDIREGAVLALAPGQEISDVVFRLVRGAAVTGKVVGEDGEPMVKVLVTALRKPNSDEREEAESRGQKASMQPTNSAVTDDRGEYRLYGMKPGEYYIEVAGSSDMVEIYGSFGVPQEGEWLDWTVQRELGSRYAALYYPGVLQVDQAEAITLRGGDEVQADFAMRHVKTVNISGSVVGANGRPVLDAYVGMGIPQIGARGIDFHAETDEKGRFEIKAVPAGSYVIEAQQQEGDKRYWVRQKLDVGGEDLDSVVLTFGKGVNIQGGISVAEGKAPAFTHMYVVLDPTTDDDSATLGMAEIKKDGSFEVTDLADGDYALEVNRSEPGCWYIKSARFGAEDVLTKGVQVEKGSSAGSLSIVLGSDCAQLEGVVTNQDKSVAGAKVRATPDPETRYNRMRSKSAETDQNGHFRISDLAPGKYKVIAKLRSGAEDAPVAASEPKVVEFGWHDHQSVALAMASADRGDAASK